MCKTFMQLAGDSPELHGTPLVVMLATKFNHAHLHTPRRQFIGKCVAMGLQWILKTISVHATREYTRGVLSSVRVQLPRWGAFDWF